MPDIWLDVDTAVNVSVNIIPLIDDTDFKTREVAIAYNEAGMDLVWNFVTSAGVMTQTAVTPTTAGDYDWTHVGDGMYKIEIPASAGASINNDTEGYGWFTGICTGVLAWRSPIYGFRAAAINDSLCDGGDFLQTDVQQWNSGGVTSSMIAVKTSLAKGTDLTGFNDLSAADVNAQVDAALDTAIPGTPTANSINERLAALDDNYTLTRAGYLDELSAANIPADIDTLLGRLTAARSGYLDELGAANVPADIDTLLTRLTAARAGYLDNLSAGAVATAAAIAALNNLSAAQVNAEMLDVLATDTFAELASVPGATSSLKDKITFLFMLARNKITQTSTTKTLRNDGDTVTVGSETVSDDGTTFTKGKMA